MNEPLYTVGILVNTQGIRGEVRVISRTDFPEKRFKKGAHLLLIHPEIAAPVTLVIKSSRQHKQFILLTFEGHESIGDVEQYKGGEIKIPQSQLEPLPEGVNYIHEIVGCTVVTDEGIELGTCVDVLQPGANDVYVVRPPKGKDILLPAIPQCVLNVDPVSKMIQVHIMSGLLE